MKLVAIQVFLALASELHFGRAAEQLALSQPSVSRIIRALEDEVGGALFERTSRKVRLTPWASACATPSAHPIPTSRPHSARRVTLHAA